MQATLGDEIPVLANVPAGVRDERQAIAVVAVSVLVFASIVPYAKVQLARVDAFVPLYQSALVIIDLVTAALLLAQWRARAAQPLLALACGYLFTALMTVSHTLTFPGLFAPQGILGAGPQSTAWIYMFWHAVFPLFVIAYVLSGSVARSPRHAWMGIVLTSALAGGFVALATKGERLLPQIMSGHQYRAEYHWIVAAVWLCSTAALACLWRRQQRTVLDVWIMVVMCIWMIEIALSAVLNAGRFDVGFYAGRIYGLAASSFILVLLIFEWQELQARVAASVAERVARERAEAANQAKDRFLATLGHELRNPLAPILTTLELMRLRDPEILTDERITIARHVDHLCVLVDHLLDLTHLTKGTLKLKPRHCDASDIAALALETATPLINARRHEVVVDMPRERLPLLVDPRRMARALCNLLSNAALHSPDGGRVRLTCERDNAYAVFKVSDQGPGIPASVRASLFEPFAQETKNRIAVGGLGIGLAIAKDLVTLHGGILALDEQYKNGTQLVIRIPMEHAVATEVTGGFAETLAYSGSPSSH